MKEKLTNHILDTMVGLSAEFFSRYLKKISDEKGSTITKPQTKPCTGEIACRMYPLIPTLRLWQCYVADAGRVVADRADPEDHQQDDTGNETPSMDDTLTTIDSMIALPPDFDADEDYEEEVDPQGNEGQDEKEKEEEVEEMASDVPDDQLVISHPLVKLISSKMLPPNVIYDE